MKSNIPNLVRRSGLTVTELAEKAKISRTIMSELANRDEIPDKTRFDALKGVSTALNVSVNDLMVEPTVKIFNATEFPLYSSDLDEIKTAMLKVVDGKIVDTKIGGTKLGAISVELGNGNLWLAYSATKELGIQVEVCGSWDIHLLKAIQQKSETVLRNAVFTRVLNDNDSFMGGVSHDFLEQIAVYLENSGLAADIYSTIPDTDNYNLGCYVAIGFTTWALSYVGEKETSSISSKTKIVTTIATKLSPNSEPFWFLD